MTQSSKGRIARKMALKKKSKDIPHATSNAHLKLIKDFGQKKDLIVKPEWLRR